MSAQISFASATALVAEREIAVKLRDRGFLIGTVVTLAFIAAALVIPALVAGRPSTYVVATVGPQAERVVAAVAEAAAQDTPDGQDDPFPFSVEVTSVGSAAAAEQAIIDGAAEIAVVDRDGDGAPVEVVGDRSVPTEFTEAVDATLNRLLVTDTLEGFGASPAEATTAVTPVTAPQRYVSESGERSVEALVLGIAFAVLFFLTSQTFGITISQSVAEEKQNRIVELLVAAVSVRALLVGKVLGNLVLALGQIVLLLAVGLLTASIVGQGEILPLLAGSAGWFVAFFVTGFAMLACLWAAAGAMASRIEDLGSTTLPTQMLVTVPFFVAISIQDEGPARAVLSYVPFTAPLVMPQRLVAGDAAWWEGVIALAIIVAVGAVLVVVADRLYRGSLLRTRGQTSMKEAWAAARG